MRYKLTADGPDVTEEEFLAHIEAQRSKAASEGATAPTEAVDGIAELTQSRETNSTPATTRQGK